MKMKEVAQPILFAVAATMILTGCPREQLMSIKNETGSTVTLLSQKASIRIPPDGLVTIGEDDMTFDRGPSQAEELRLEGLFGSRCYALVYAGMGLTDDDLSFDSRTHPRLIISAQGHVFVLPRSRGDLDFDKLPAQLETLPALKPCTER